MNKFMELHDSYELYEFARQYYMDIETIKLKEMKFPVAVYFDDETGRPAFQSAEGKNFQFKIKFQADGETYLYAANSIDEIVEFVRAKGKKKVKSGDMVRVVNYELAQPKNFNFFRDNFIDYEYACKFNYGTFPHEGFTYKVVVRCGDTLLIQDTDTEECYLIDEKGVEIA